MLHQIKLTKCFKLIYYSLPNTEDKEKDMAEALTTPLESIFDTLTEVANKLKENRNTQNLHSALNSLQSCVEKLAHFVQNEQNQKTNHESTIREHEDEKKKKG